MADLQIIGAAYGLGVVTLKVIDLVNRQSTPQTLSVTASNDVFSDTWPGVQKSLIVAYRYGNAGAVGVATAKEGSTITIQDPPSGVQALSGTSQPQLSVLAAAYGPQDETPTVQAMINQSTQSLSFTANNQTFGDSWPGTAKSFVIVAAYDGQVPFVDVVAENSSYSLKYRPPLIILSASWGLANVTNTMRNLTFRRTLSIVASNQVLGVDGWQGQTKSLDVVYQYGNQKPQLAIATEGNTMSFDYAEQPDYHPAPDASALNVIAAAHGQANVTSKVIGQLGGSNTLNFTANNTLFGDNWPGTVKSFMLSYSWGPTSPQTLIVAENGSVQISQPMPSITSGLVSQTGLFSPGDNIAIQSAQGLFLAVSPTGQLIANAASIENSTMFKVQAVPSQSDQFTLSNGPTNVVVGPDGTLSAASSGTAAAFIASLTTTGTSMLSVVGAGKVYTTLRDDGAIVAAGSDEPTFNTTFGLMLNATQEGLKNHLLGLGIDPDTMLLPQGDTELKLIQLAWDLTGGMFLAIGLGPLINDSLQIQTGALALIQSKPSTNAALTNLINAVKANLGSTLKVGALLAFAVTVWDAGLWWKILRLAYESGKWYMITWAATKVLQVTVLPELQAAQLVVSFAKWTYDTTIDAIAYINVVGGTPRPNVRTNALVFSANKKVGLLDDKPSLQDSDTFMNGINGEVSLSARRGFAANGVPDDEDDEEDLKDQLQAIEIRRKLRGLRKRRSVQKGL